MRIIFVYPPFCTPTIFPYSITNLHTYISKNLKLESKAIDLNAVFHKNKFSKYYPHAGNPDTLARFNKESMEVYAKNNRAVRQDKDPEMFSELMDLILEEKPDVVAFSIVYNNQVFYTLRLIEALKKQGVECICGGPSVAERILKVARFFEDKEEVYGYLIAEKGVKANSNKEFPLDFSIYNAKNYLSPEPIYPIKTQESCYYRQCTFCTHHKNKKYKPLDLDIVKQTIELNDAKYVHFIDDMLSKQRLKEIAKFMKGRKWTISLRPTKEFIMDFSALHESGLHSISWGFESGSQRILDLMKKGTKTEEIEQVLKCTHDAGIKNILFTLFGFPGETKEEFFETLEFLKRNSSNIDLVSTSIFGLQQGSYVYEHPKEFGINDIKICKREVLDNKITFTMSTKPYDADELRKNYKKTIENMNKLPKVYAVFKDQVLFC